MIKLIYCLRKRDDIDSDSFYRYWLEEHGPLVKSVAGDRLNQWPMLLQPIAIKAVAVDVVTFSKAINKFDHRNVRSL